MFCKNQTTWLRSLPKGRARGVEYRDVVASFSLLVDFDLHGFLAWFEERREDVDLLFIEQTTRHWEAYVAAETKHAKENARMSLMKRGARLRKMIKQAMVDAEAFAAHMASSRDWCGKIQSLSVSRQQKNQQDTQTTRTLSICNGASRSTI